MDPSTDPTPILTWHAAATPTTAIVALAFLLTLLVLPVVLFQLNAIRAHLRASRIHIRESRDWLRRNAAEQRAAEYHTLVYKPHLLTRHLDYIERQSTVTLESIRQARTEDPEVIDALHSLLDYFEGLARGIEHGVLSERIIKAAHHDSMLRAIRIFRPYIEHYRMQSTPDAWFRIEALLAKWESPDAAPAQGEPAQRKRAA